MHKSRESIDEQQKALLPESEVIVKFSLCQKCTGVVRHAIKHMMNKKDKRAFADEAMQYNLIVNVLPLQAYRSEGYKWCRCESDGKR